MTGLHFILPLGFFVLLTAHDAAWASKMAPRCELLVSALKLEQTAADLDHNNSPGNDEGRLREISKDLHRINELVEQSFSEHLPTKQVSQFQKQTQAVLSLISSGLPDQAIATLNSDQYDKSLQALRNFLTPGVCQKSEVSRPPSQSRISEISGDSLNPSHPDTGGSIYKQAAELLNRLNPAESGSGSLKALLIMIMGLVALFAPLSLSRITAARRDKSLGANASESSCHSYPRFDCDLPCLIRLGKDSVLETRCHSISQDGFSILCIEHTRPGDVAVIRLGGLIQQCEAVWSGRKTSGFRFTEILDGDVIFNTILDDGASEPSSSSRLNASEDLALNVGS